MENLIAKEFATEEEEYSRMGALCKGYGFSVGFHE